MKQILVTGHKGYLGSAFVDRYGEQYEITGFDMAEGQNLLDADALTVTAAGCEQIVHLAAIPAPVEGRSFDEYLAHNVLATHNVVKAAIAAGARRVVYASSTTIYGIERGIPFQVPITEDQSFVSQSITADQLACRDVDLSYHMSKVMAEQIMAWYGLNKKVETVALRFGPINKVFFGTSVSIENATMAIHNALECKDELWYEPLSIVDEIDHISIEKARHVIGYDPETPSYSDDQIRSSVEERYKIESA